MLTVANNSWRFWLIRLIFSSESFLSMIMTSSWWCRKHSSTIPQPLKITLRAKVFCGESIDWCQWWTLKTMMILLCATKALHWRCFRPTWWIGWIDECCQTFILTVLNKEFLVSLWVLTITQPLMNWMTLNLHWEIATLSGDLSASDTPNIFAVNPVTLLSIKFHDMLSHQSNGPWLLLSEQWWTLPLNWSWLSSSEQWWFWPSDWQWIYSQDERRFIESMRFGSSLS